MSDLISQLNAALEGRYAVERHIGKGGMATVFLARDERRIARRAAPGVAAVAIDTEGRHE